MSLERAKSDQLVADIDFDDLESRLEKMEKKSQTDNIEKTKNEIFDPARYQVMNKLITADAITNVVQLEHRLKDERYMKTRFTLKSSASSRWKKPPHFINRMNPGIFLIFESRQGILNLNSSVYIASKLISNDT